MHTAPLVVLPQLLCRTSHAMYIPCADLFPEGVVIPVLRGILPDFDVVYAPLISSYGSCTGAVFHTGTCLALEEALLHCMCGGSSPISVEAGRQQGCCWQPGCSPG